MEEPAQVQKKLTFLGFCYILDVGAKTPFYIKIYGEIFDPMEKGESL